MVANKHNRVDPSGTSYSSTRLRTDPEARIAGESTTIAKNQADKTDATQTTKVTTAGTQLAEEFGAIDLQDPTERDLLGYMTIDSRKREKVSPEMKPTGKLLATRARSAMQPTRKLLTATREKYDFAVRVPRQNTENMKKKTKSKMKEKIRESSDEWETKSKSSEKPVEVVICKTAHRAHSTTSKSDKTNRSERVQATQRPKSGEKIVDEKIEENKTTSETRDEEEGTEEAPIPVEDHKDDVHEELKLSDVHEELKLSNTWRDARRKRDIILTSITIDGCTGPEYAPRLLEMDLCTRSLFAAIYHGHMDDFHEVFIDEPGINLNQLDKMGRSPCDFAAIMGEFDMLEILLKKGGRCYLSCKPNIRALARLRAMGKNTSTAKVLS